MGVGLVDANSSRMDVYTTGGVAVAFNKPIGCGESAYQYCSCDLQEYRRWWVTTLCSPVNMRITAVPLRERGGIVVLFSHHEHAVSHVPPRRVRHARFRQRPDLFPSQ